MLFLTFLSVSSSARCLEPRGVKLVEVGLLIMKKHAAICSSIYMHSVVKLNISQKC